MSGRPVRGGPNGGRSIFPDEKGIETKKLEERCQPKQSRSIFPDEKGIETLSPVSVS